MRLRRIIPQALCVFHFISRLVDGLSLLSDTDKEAFLQLMHRCAQFCGVDIDAYSIMSTHFHIAGEIDPTREIGQEELFERVERFYGSDSAQFKTLVKLRDSGKTIELAALCNQYRCRMNQPSNFMKELKQAFSRLYNQRHDRFGTLWAERFTSVLIEPASEALRCISIYIDLNAPRAGMAADPKDYRFCSYSEALAGSQKACQGICRCMGEPDWEKAAALYRQFLFAAGAESKDLGKAQISKEAALKVLRDGGKLSAMAVLWHRIRYFSGGVVIGSEAYVNEVYAKYRDRFGPNRRRGAHRMRGADWNLFALRDLRARLFG
jgi:putative transposase